MVKYLYGSLNVNNSSNVSLDLLKYLEVKKLEFWLSYIIALMIANSKLVYGLIKLLNMLSPKRISKYLKYFLLALSLFTRNTVFLAVSLIFMLHSESMKDFRVKFSWIILHADMLVVDAWRLTDMKLH
jgi:hypothetical protein